MKQKLLTPEMKDSLKESFKLLKDEVDVHIFTQKGTNDHFNGIVTEFIRELATLDERIKAKFHKVGDAAARKYGVQRSPTILVSPGKYGIRFTGAPMGEESRGLIMTLILVSRAQTAMSEESRKRLQRLDKKRHVMVFGSPT